MLRYDMTWDEPMSHHLIMQNNAWGKRYQNEIWSNYVCAIYMYMYNLYKYHLRSSSIQKYRWLWVMIGIQTANTLTVSPRGWVNHFWRFSRMSPLLMTLPMHFKKNDLFRNTPPQQKLNIYMYTYIRIINSEGIENFKFSTSQYKK